MTPAPADAKVLFDGTNTDAWTRPWKIEDGAMVVTKGLGSNETREKFGDMQLHLEFATPAEVKGNGPSSYDTREIFTLFLYISWLAVSIAFHVAAASPIFMPLFMTSETYI